MTTANSNLDHRRVGEHTRVRRLVPLASLLLLLACCSAAPGSLISVQPASLDAKALMPERQSGAATNRTLPDRRQTQPANEPGPVLLLVDGAMPSGSSTSGNPAPVNGGGASSPIAFDSFDRCGSDDTKLILWIHREGRFSLPTPPVNELLRPPRDV